MHFSDLHILASKMPLIIEFFIKIKSQFGIFLRTDKNNNFKFTIKFLMTLDRSYIGYLGILGIDLFKSVLIYSNGAICLIKLLFDLGLFTVHHVHQLPLPDPSCFSLVTTFDVELVSPTVGMCKVGIALRCLAKDLVQLIVLQQTVLTKLNDL